MSKKQKSLCTCCYSSSSALNLLNFIATTLPFTQVFLQGPLEIFKGNLF